MEHTLGDFMQIYVQVWVRFDTAALTTLFFHLPRDLLVSTMTSCASVSKSLIKLKQYETKFDQILYIVVYKMINGTSKLLDIV